MLDGTPVRTVWGFAIEVSPTGRNRWPEALKRMAAVKVLDEDRQVSSIAREIKANETMVWRWVSEERDRRRTQNSGAPAFVEVIVSEPEPPVPPESTGLEEERPAPRLMFQLEIGSTKVALPTELTEPEITRIIRGVRAAL